MKTIKGYSILSREEQMTREDEAFKKGESRSAERIAELERAVERKSKTIEQWQNKYYDAIAKHEREIEILNNKLTVLTEERSEAAEVLRLQLKLEADELALEARAKYLDRREDNLAKLAESMKWDKAPAPQMQITPGTLPYYPDQSYQQRPF